MKIRGDKRGFQSSDLFAFLVFAADLYVQLNAGGSESIEAPSFWHHPKPPFSVLPRSFLSP